MAEDEMFFYLEPFVHQAEGSSSILFYNALSGVAIEIPATPKVKQITDQWTNIENGYVASFGSEAFMDQDVIALFDNLRRYYMGDIWKPAWSQLRPFNLVPVAAFKHSLPPESDQGQTMIDASNQHHFLKELAFCLNSDTLNMKPGRINGFRQFLFPSPSTADYQELDFELLHHIILSLDKYRLPQLSFTGFNPFLYSKWIELLKLIEPLKTIRQFSLDLSDLSVLTLKRLLKMPSTRLQIYHYPPFNNPVFNPEIINLIRRSKKVELKLLISSEEDYYHAEEFVKTHNIQQYSVKPNLLQGNLEFFKNFVFLTREEILASRPVQREVLSRQTLNELNYGMLVILTNGEVFANPNDPPLGNLQSGTLNQFIENEVLSGISWNRTRSQVTPCKTCIYRFLCPPISGYELLANRFNFCNVIPENR